MEWHELAPRICEHFFQELGQTPNKPRRACVCHVMRNVSTVNVFLGLGANIVSAA